jgi:hypothetical protein
MGSWDETCALTHTGIREDDPVVLVRVKIEEVHLRLVGHMGDAHQQLHYLWPYVRTVEAGAYDDYGDIKGLGLGSREDRDAIHLFFHEAAWDLAVAFVTAEQARDARWKKRNGFEVRDELTVEAMLDRNPTGDIRFARDAVRFAGIAAAADPTKQPELDFARAELQRLLDAIPARLGEFMKVCRMASMARIHLLPPASGPQFLSESLPYQTAVQGWSRAIVAAQKRRERAERF